jgi:hypothetical protein
VPKLPLILPVCDLCSHTHELSNTPIGPSTLDTIGVPAAKKTSNSPPPPSAAETQSAYAEKLAAVPAFGSYGTILNSSAKPVQLTESETEYQVTCVKHIFKEHIVFQVCEELYVLVCD